MEIQNIPGFKLPATPVTGSTPSSRFNRGRGCSSGMKRWRTAAEVKTLDFGAGLEAYIPPRVLPKPKRPSSSRQRRRSKDQEIQLDIDSEGSAVEAIPTTKSEVESDLNERSRSAIIHTPPRCETSGHAKPCTPNRESDLHQLANCNYKEWVDSTVTIIAPQVALERTQTISRLELKTTKKVGENVSSATSPGSVALIDSPECKFHAELSREPAPPSPQQSEVWFKRTLQQYEDLKKSVDAQISSAPSSVNERVDNGSDLDNGNVAASWAGTPRKHPPAFSDVGTSDDRMSWMNVEGGADTARIDQLRKLRNDVSANHSTRKDVPANMPREGRPLWERPEHATGKYLIHSTSSIPDVSLASTEEKTSTTISDKRTATLATGHKKCGTLTSFSCGCSSKRVNPIALMTFSCGCPPQQVLPKPRRSLPLTYSCQCLSRQRPFTAGEGSDHAAWKQLVDTVTHLRDVNRGLQQTVEELMRRERQTASCSENKEVEAGMLLECWGTKKNVRGIKLGEPEVRKHVVDTLRNSVDRMQSLMLALKEEQERSQILSGKLNSFLALKGDASAFCQSQNRTLVRSSTGNPTSEMQLPFASSSSKASPEGNTSYDIPRPPSENGRIALRVKLTTPFSPNRENLCILSRNRRPSKVGRVGKVFSI